MSNYLDDYVSVQDRLKEFINAYEAGEMHVALFWQNEQIMKKLSDLLFAYKEGK